MEGRWKDDVIMSALGGRAKLHRARAQHLAGTEPSSRESSLAEEDRRFEQTSGYAKGPVMAQSCPLTGKHLDAYKPMGCLRPKLVIPWPSFYHLVARVSSVKASRFQRKTSRAQAIGNVDNADV